MRDRNSKILLFTSLQMLIGSLCTFFAENNIIYRNFMSSNRQRILADFRLNPEVEVRSAACITMKDNKTLVRDRSYQIQSVFGHVKCSDFKAL